MPDTEFATLLAHGQQLAPVFKGPLARNVKVVSGPDQLATHAYTAATVLNIAIRLGSGGHASIQDFAVVSASEADQLTILRTLKVLEELGWRLEPPKS